MKLINKQTIVAALIGALSALFLAVGGVALAHSGGHGPKGAHLTPEKIEERVSEMTERLGLSPQQERQVRTILEEARVQAEELKEMPRSKEKFVAMRDLRFATEDQIYANLSCEQRDELRLLKREHRVKRMEARYRQHHQD
jgi:Spy/CpxP family protein refolding chaperone